MRKITHLVVHHVGSMPAGFPVENPVPTIRAWHTDPNKPGGPFADIAYQKLITPAGAVKQGRADGIPGAHAYGANANTIGVLIVADGDAGPIPPAQRKATVQTLAILARRHGVPVANIIGHCDVARLFPGGASSACPGKFITADLPAIRAEVAGLI